MNKKNFINESIVLFFLMFTVGIHFGIGQDVPHDLLRDLYGTWKVTEYQSKIVPQPSVGAVVFQSDGGFLSEGFFFGSTKGLFRTDESRSIIVIETTGVSTEWAASFKNGVLRLRSSPRSKRPRVAMELTKNKEEVEI